MQDAFGVERGLVSKKNRGGPGWDSDEAVERYQHNVKADGAYVSRQGTRRAKNWGVLSGYTAGGAVVGGALGAATGSPAGAAAGAGTGALFGAAAGAGHNEARAHQRAFKVAEASGDIREPRKGERTSEYHGGKIVPKKEYKKAQLKFLKKENASLRTELGKKYNPSRREEMKQQRTVAGALGAVAWPGNAIYAGAKAKKGNRAGVAGRSLGRSALEGTIGAAPGVALSGIGVAAKNPAVARAGSYLSGAGGMVGGWHGSEAAMRTAQRQGRIKYKSKD